MISARIQPESRVRSHSAFLFSFFLREIDKLEKLSKNVIYLLTYTFFRDIISKLKGVSALCLQRLSFDGTLWERQEVKEFG